jgi:NAD(P)H-dependent FMN reductase
VSDSRLKLAVIIGSIREGRFAPVVANWFLDYARQRPELAIDTIDLADNPVAGNGRSFADRIGEADAFIVITPEYNHGYPGALKAAIDSVKQEWYAKPVGFVSYGGVSGGLRSVEQLRVVFAELHMVSVRETVSFHRARGEFNEGGEPRYPEAVNPAADALLDQLAWWATALRQARAQTPYGQLT